MIIMSDRPPIDGTIFYIVSNVVTADGECDFDVEIPSMALTMAAAIRRGRSTFQDCPGEAVIFECRAVRKVIIDLRGRSVPIPS